jgi:hypothetical protein
MPDINNKKKLEDFYLFWYNFMRIFHYHYFEFEFSINIKIEISINIKIKEFSSERAPYILLLFFV